MKRSRAHLPSLFASLLFVLGGLLLVGTTLLMAITILSALLSGLPVEARTTVFLFAFGFQALVLFAAAFFAFQKFMHRAAADRPLSLRMPLWLAILLIVAAGAAIGLGYLLEEQQPWDWLALPILTVPAIVLPLLVFLGWGVQRLPLASRWQAWSILGLAMTAGPFLLVLAEIVLGLVLVTVAVVYILTQPELAAQMQRLSEQMMILGPESEAARQLISPFLTNPTVIATVLVYMSLLVPAIEEVLKPLGVWLFGRSFSPAQGFALGALSGAGYALIETIGVSGQQTADWATLLSSRIGTGLLHITTSALMGAAIVLALRERRWLRLLGTYLLAILLHGLWNALAMVFTFSTLAEFFELPGRLGTLQPAMVVSMVILAMGLFAILILSNRKWRRTLEPAPPLPAPAIAAETVGPTETMVQDTAAVDETNPGQPS